MNNYIRILALALVASAASMQAWDDANNLYASTNPWEPTKREIKLANKRVKLGHELYGAYGDV